MRSKGPRLCPRVEVNSFSFFCVSDLLEYTSVYVHFDVMLSEET